MTEEIDPAVSYIRIVSKYKMENRSVVRLHASVKVNESDWEVFEKMVGEVREIVLSEGPEKVLTHETYRKEDSFECLIIEAYVNEQTFLNHLELIRPVSEKYDLNWKVNRLELSGAYSEETVKAMKVMTGESEFYYYRDPVG